MTSIPHLKSTGAIVELPKEYVRLYTTVSRVIPSLANDLCTRIIRRLGLQEIEWPPISLIESVIRRIGM